MCIDIIEVWFGIAYRQMGLLIGKFHQFMTEFLVQHDNGVVLSFHVFICPIDWLYPYILLSRAV